MPYSVVIVDDEKMVLNSLSLGYDWSSTNFEVIATFQNSREALRQIKLLKPDLVFSDIKMPGLNGLDMMAEIRSELPSIQFVFISGYEDFSFARKALTMGACGYCLKPLEDEEISEVLDQVHLSLVQTQNNLDALFYSMIQSRSEETTQMFTASLSSQCNFNTHFCIAASIREIDSELQGYVSFTKIRYEKETFFYFINDTFFLDTPGLHQRIRHKIQNETILNFSYIKLPSTKNLVEHLELLLNHVYSFFFRKQDISFHYEIEPADQIPASSFFRKLEEAYCKDHTVEIMETLKNYQSLYGEEERTITEALRIYNLVMATLFRKDHSYFDEPFTRPYQLINNFACYDDMISYLIQTIGSQNSSFGKLNLDLIKNETFKQILCYINENFTNPISFQKICQDHSINPSYLSQIFQREMNTTFTNYLTDLRINLAKELLVHTNMLISEVSEKVGYDQYFYFSKIFKKYTTLSPTQYREQMQKSNTH